MHRMRLIAIVGALVVGLLAIAMLFGSAFAQPIFNGMVSPGTADQGEFGSCHTSGDSTDGGQGHMTGLAAKALGVDEAALRQALDSGQSLAAIAKDRGLDEANLDASLIGAMREAMQQRVQDGLLSQAQADEMLQHMEQMGAGHQASMLDGNMPAGMMGSGMMGGQNHGAMMGGQSHGGMMAGQGHGGMMGGVVGDSGTVGASCHTDYAEVSQTF